MATLLTLPDEILGIIIECVLEGVEPSNKAWMAAHLQLVCERLRPVFEPVAWRTLVVYCGRPGRSRTDPWEYVRHNSTDALTSFRKYREGSLFACVKLLKIVCPDRLPKYATHYPDSDQVYEPISSLPSLKNIILVDVTLDALPIPEHHCIVPRPLLSLHLKFCRTTINGLNTLFQKFTEVSEVTVCATGVPMTAVAVLPSKAGMILKGDVLWPQTIERVPVAGGSAPRTTIHKFTACCTQFSNIFDWLNSEDSWYDHSGIKNLRVDGEVMQNDSVGLDKFLQGYGRDLTTLAYQTRLRTLSQEGNCILETLAISFDADAFGENGTLPFGLQDLVGPIRTCLTNYQSIYHAKLHWITRLIFGSFPLAIQCRLQTSHHAEMSECLDNAPDSVKTRDLLSFGHLSTEIRDIVQSDGSITRVDRQIEILQHLGIMSYITLDRHSEEKLHRAFGF
ncbi:uncharacterized protein EV420DRAFT_1472660 [Desarmillaria tabescens]|uniref:Uncharacterized protein n=1 Tax=Armillaria tabescens TaxID=1929756 RepID=A0AA39NPI5_ARMTA|nr:uncharacterized protein EV420DRAFT_1472660 [Desarmillaria tabescens]KAK0469426.1 hypothetical protein EV420DRAFT_1472660 [Desarmillaria tabescens]